MRRCRRTDTIADIVADPALGAEALTDEQRGHVAICADCHAAVANLERLDRALTADLRSFRRENLPISVLATPALPTREAERAGRAAFLLSAAAVVATIAVAVGGYGWLRGAGLGQQPPMSAAPSSAVAPTAVATAQPSAVPDPAAELAVGEIAAVVDEPLVVRTDPGTSPATTITEDRLWIGQRVRILAGPEESDGYTWWEIQVGEISGWVADAERDESAPWLSPIGNGRIAFSRDQGSGNQQPGLFTVDLNGENEQRLDAPESAGIRLVLSCGSAPGPARWSQDGGWVTFDAIADGVCDRAVHVAREDGSEQRTIGDGWGPVWRPDGREVTYAENPPNPMCGRECGDVADATSELMTAEPAAGPPTPLTRSDPFFTAFGPAWSPDRQSIAFGGWTTPESGEATFVSYLYIADADGANVRRLTMGQFPVWSPDGRWIVFSVPLPEGTTELHRIRPDGSDETLLATGEYPVFSPDGTRIAYADEWGVMTMAADGSDASGVIPAAAVVGIEWSPDGSQLVAAADYADSFGLYRIGLEGAAPAIFGMGVNGYAPTWQPVLLDARLLD